MRKGILFAVKELLVALTLRRAGVDGREPLWEIQEQATIYTKKIGCSVYTLI